MAFLNIVILLLLVLFGVAFCQIQYIPANILIPTFNGSLFLSSNHSAYNKTNNGVPAVNNSYYRPPYQFGRNYSNNSNNLSAYNGSQEGHLIVGKVQAFDRLLFTQVRRLF